MQAIYSLDEQRTTILLAATPALVVMVPLGLVVEQLHDGYGATKH